MITIMKIMNNVSVVKFWLGGPDPLDYITVYSNQVGFLNSAAVFIHYSVFYLLTYTFKIHIFTEDQNWLSLCSNNLYSLQSLRIMSSSYLNTSEYRSICRGQCRAVSVIAAFLRPLTAICLITSLFIYNNEAI